MPRIIDRIKRKLNGNIQKNSRSRKVGVTSNQKNINTIEELKDYARNQDDLTQEDYIQGGPYGDNETHILLGNPPYPKPPYLTIVEKDGYFILIKITPDEEYILGAADNEKAIVNKTLEEI